MSGATIGGIVGGAIGFVVSGFNPMGAQIGFMAGSYIGSSFDSYHTPGPRLGDLPVQTVQEGAIRAILYGTTPPIMGNIIQAGPKVRIIVEEDTGGGKGGPSYTTDHEEVYQTFAIAYAEGNADLKLLRLWADGKLFYDAFGGVLDADSVTAQTKFTFHPGGEDQMPSPVLQALPREHGGGVDQVLAHRDSAYVVFDNFNLTAYGGRIPQIQAQFSTNATITQSCTEGLLAWWPLDDSSTGVAREIVSGLDGYYGNLLGSATHEARASLNHTGSGATWFGPNDFMKVDNAGSLSRDPTDPWTVTVWYVIDADHIAQNKILGVAYVDAFSGKHAWGNHLGNYLSTGNYLTAAGGYDNGSNHFAISPTEIAPARIIQQATRFTGTSIDLFINGVLVDSLAIAAAGGVVDYVFVGGSFNGLVGTVQDLQFWGRALSDTELLNQYLAGPTFFEIPDAPGTFMTPDGTVLAPCASSAETSNVTLASIVEDIARRAGVDASQLDLAADEDVEVQGYLIGRQTTAQGALVPLATAYFRNYPEYDEQIHSIPLGGAVVADLTSNADLLESNEDEFSTRQLIEQPRKVIVAYSDPAANYATRNQHAERESLNIPATGDMTIELPVVFGADEAAQKAEIITKCLYEEATGTYQFRLPFYKWAHLVPTDCVTLDGVRLRIGRIEVMDGEMHVEAVRDRASNYESAAVGGVALDPTAPVSSVRGPSVGQALNLPRLVTSQDTAGMVFGVTGLTSSWPGADIWVKWPGATEEVFVFTATKRATMGYLLDDIATSADPIGLYVYDQRPLASISADQLTAGLNGLAITTGGTSELKQFQNAAETSTDNEWDVSDLSHGRLGTTNATHDSGDLWMLLDNNLYFLEVDASYAGQDIEIRPVTRGTPRENNESFTVTFMPQFTGPEDVEYLETLDGEYVETLDGLRLEFFNT